MSVAISPPALSRPELSPTVCSGGPTTPVWTTNGAARVPFESVTSNPNWKGKPRIGSLHPTGSWTPLMSTVGSPGVSLHSKSVAELSIENPEPNTVSS